MIARDPHGLATETSSRAPHLGPTCLCGKVCTTFEVSPKPKNEHPVPQSDPYAVVAHCPGWDPVWQSLGSVLGSLGRAGWTLEASELAEVAPGKD